MTFPPEYVRPRINFIFGGEMGVYRRLSARDNLKYFANLYYIDGGLIFKVDFSGVNFGFFALITFIAMFAAAGFGLLLSMLGLISDSIHFILNLSAYVLMIFCGANFPIAQLPQAGQYISRMLPLTRSIQAANMLFGPIDLKELWGLLLGEALLGAAYFLVGFVFIRLVERLAVKKATLDIF